MPGTYDNIMSQKMKVSCYVQQIKALLFVKKRMSNDSGEDYLFRIQGVFRVITSHGYACLLHCAVLFEKLFYVTFGLKRFLGPVCFL